MLVQGKKQATRHVATATGAARNEIPSTSDTNFIKYIREDAVLNANLCQVQDGVFEGFPRVDNNKKSKTEINKYNEQLEKQEVGKKLKDFFPSLYYNGNMVFEIKAVGNKLMGFYPIDANTMKAVESDTGETLEYIQTGLGGKDIHFSPKKIIHIKAPVLRTGVWATPLLEPLKYPLARKSEAENYLAGMIANLHPLLFINLEESDDLQVRAIQNELRAPRKPLDPLKVIALLNEEKVGRVDTGNTENFDSIFRYIDKQNEEIVRVVRIPPIVAGTVDNSNRSNSEIQERAVFGRNVHAWQNYLANELRREFENKLGWKDFFFEFPVEDERKMEAALVRATKLKELGYSIEAIHPIIEEAGIKVEAKFEETQPNITKDINDMPSRQPRDKGGIPQNEAQRQNDIQNGTKKEAQ